MKPWTYDADVTHGWIIFREGREYAWRGVERDDETGGRLIGTSEWAWADEDDLKALCELLNKHKFVAPSETEAT